MILYCAVRKKYDKGAEMETAVKRERKQKCLSGFG